MMSSVTSSVTSMSPPVPAIAFQAAFPVHLAHSSHLINRSYRSITRPEPAKRQNAAYLPIFSSQTRPTTAPPSPTTPPQNLPVPPTPPNPITSYQGPTGTPGAFAQLAKDCQTVPDLFAKLSAHPRLADLPALIDDHHGASVTLTFSQLGSAIQTCAKGLRELGLSQGDLVSLFSENSHRWCIIDQAIMTCGAAAAVRGVAAPTAELRFIYENSQSCALFVEDRSALKRVIESGVDLSSAKFVIMLFGSLADAASLLPDGARLLSFEDIMKIGESASPAVQNGDIQTGSRSDIATLLYTSGTTGNPKGVVLTHDNMLTQLQYISLGNLDPHPGEVFVSILPCWHVFERTACYWSLSKGVNLVYSNKRNFRDDLVKYQPHMLISVPRVFENLHATIMGRLRKASAMRKMLFSFFFTASLIYVQSRRRIRGLDLAGTPSVIGRALDAFRMILFAPIFALANLLIWRKIRAGMGGRLRICLSGGGTIAGYLEDFFECAGIEIVVGYGLTETSPVIANRFGERNVRGSTGMPCTCVDVKIVDPDTGDGVPYGDVGVLQVYGRSVFREYWQNAEATAKAFDKDGYFDTGDLACFSPGGDIVITGRSKDLIVLSNGENIEPAGIEDAVLGSRFIDQVMLVGQDQRALGALVIPQLAELQEAGVISMEFRGRIKELLKMGDVGKSELKQAEEELSTDVDFLKVMKDEIVSRNTERVSYSANDNIVPIRVLLVPFSVENGMMTQTLKIKKDVVAKVYASEIAGMFKIV